MKQDREKMEGTIRCSANYVPLSPISFLERAAVVFGGRTSVVYGDIQYTWHQTRDRCVRLASALSDLGLSRHNVVAALAPNVPALCELHFGAPMAGAVLCVLNTHFDSQMLAMALEKTKPKVFFVDSKFLSVAEESLNLLSNIQEQPLIITITENPTEKHVQYEDFLSSGNPYFKPLRPVDECDPIALNFTSGTTSTPKCVVYSHRGAYLNAIAVGVINEMKPMPVKLWTVPMYHCSGWCSVWTVAAFGGVNVYLSEVNDEVIYGSVVEHKVTHFGGSPALLNMIANAHDSVKKLVPWTVQVMSGGSPPPPELILRLKKLGFKVMTAFGCIEVYGAGTACLWMPEWETLPEDESLKLKARDGLNHFAMEAVDVVDPTTMKSVPHDGKTIGEIVLRGNTVMSGYFKEKEATEAAFRGGWFWSRDMGVIDPDGYIHLKDRSQDVITCGADIVGSTEIEGILYSHPAVYEAAVIGRPDEALGESICAFMKLKEGVEAKEEEIIEFCERKLRDKNKKMVPKTLVFSDLPKTSTGKTQKNVLRKMAKDMGYVPMKVVE